MAQRVKTPDQTEAEGDLHLGPFRLEGSKRLWRGEQLVDVRPRPLAVLRYLAERPGRLVTGEELLKQLWPGIYVTKTVLRVCVREIRQALNEDSATSQCIETVGRQGYRFIVPIATTPLVSGSRFQVSGLSIEEEDHRLGTWNVKPETLFVGREQELARLQELWERAERGERQLVFVLGEPGMGKTALVDHFLAQLRTPGQVRIGRGQCVEHYGSGEAYLPLLEALGQLCGGLGGEQVLAMLRRHAPLWLAQLVGLLDADEREAVQRHVQGSTQERMMRELAETLEAVAADTMLVLVLEDLQWSDASTLDALAYLAQRRRPVQLYILGTYRPTDVVVSGHPLRQVVQELYGRRQCEELDLELLTEAEVEEYLRQHFGRGAVSPELSHMMYQRTDGNALFMASFVDYLVQQGLLIEVEGQVQLRADRLTLAQLLPASLQQMILRQIETLPADEEQLLRVASVGGMSFTAAEVAEVIGRTLDDVEEVCDRLANREQLITMVGIAEWRDGTVTVQYEFRHALYQQVLYEQMGEARRVRLHRQLGEWKAERYGEGEAEIAGELAVHFTAGRDYCRAVQYHCQAGETALRRSAYEEAISHYREGYNLLAQLPDTMERQRRELALRMILSVALTATQGYGAEELVRNLTRARELCLALKDDVSLVSVLIGLGRFYDLRADHEAIKQLMDEEHHLLERVQEPILAIQLHAQLGTGSITRGALVQAQEHHARVLELYNPQWHRELVLRFGADPVVTAGVLSGWSLWLTGWPDQARARIEQSLRRAKELDHPFSLAFAFINAARVQLWRGDFADAGRLAEEGVSVASEHGIVWFIRAGNMLQGCMRVQRGEYEAGLSILMEMVSQYRSIGALHVLPLHLSSVVGAYWKLGRIDEGLATVTEALYLTETSASVFWAAELHRLRGELLLNAERGMQNDERKTKKKGRAASSIHHSSFIIHRSAQAEAEACFLTAIEIARQQEAKSLELRAVLSLVRLWQQQGKSAEAHTLLAKIYDWFTEGFDTKDLQEAKELLDALT